MEIKIFTKKLLACCSLTIALCTGIDVHAQNINTFAGNGFGAGQFMGGYSGDGGQAIDAEFMFPFFVVIDNAGNKYVADAFNNVIRKIDTAGVITTVAGSGVAGYGGDGGPATGAELNTPNALSLINGHLLQTVLIILM